MMMRYIFEAEVMDKNHELVGRFRYFFKVDNDIIAKTLVRIIKDSLNKGFSPYYGNGSIVSVRTSRLEDLT